MMDTDKMPTIPLVQLYGIEYDATLRQATKRLIDAREKLDTLTFNCRKLALEVEIASAARIVLNIIAAVRRECIRIRKEWEYYSDKEAATTYMFFLTHLLNRGLYGMDAADSDVDTLYGESNTEKDRLTPAERKEPTCQNLTSPSDS